MCRGYEERREGKRKRGCLGSVSPRQGRKWVIGKPWAQMGKFPASTMQMRAQVILSARFPFLM